MVKIEVVYALPNKQCVVPLTLKAPCTVKTALHHSSILEIFPDLMLDELSVGIFSQRVTLDTWLNPGDRIEIYRPLLIDPKQARRKRANKRKLQFGLKSNALGAISGNDSVRELKNVAG